MVIIFRPNVLILINIFSNISQILDKIFCRHSTIFLCLLGRGQMCALSNTSDYIPMVISMLHSICKNELFIPVRNDEKEQSITLIIILID